MLFVVKAVRKKISGLKGRWEKKSTERGKNTVIDQKELGKSIVFCLFCIILFFGISSYMLIGDMMTIPKKSSDPDYIYGYDYTKLLSYPDFWVIRTGDNKITNIENIIIGILMLWGFLRVVDLLRFMEKYKSI